MARKHNPFEAKEPSVLQTPWGDFEIRSANKSRLAAIDDLMDAYDDLDENAKTGETVALLMRSIATGLDRGSEFLELVQEKWEADEVTMAELKAAADFVREETSGATDAAIEAGNG